MRFAVTIAALLLAGCGAPGGPTEETPREPGPGPDAPGPVGAPPSIGGCAIFPADNPWNRDISAEPVDPNSAAYLAQMSPGNALHLDLGSTEEYYGIPYTVVPADQPLVTIEYGVDGENYEDESDPGPMPIPLDAPIEGGSASNPNPDSGDRHVIVLRQGDCTLFELYRAVRIPGGFRVASSARWDLTTNHTRPPGWTSADAAGLPILPGLLKYEEAAAGDIRHALRFTVPRVRRAYTAPASHCGQHADPALPPYGLRVRLKASVSLEPYGPRTRAVLAAMQRYGLILADQGSAWYVTGTSHPGWAEVIDELRERPIRGSDFEVVKLGPIVTC